MGRLDALKGGTKMSVKNCKIKIGSLLNEEGWNSKLESFYYFGILSEKNGMNADTNYYHFDSESYYRNPDDLIEWVSKL